MQIVNKEAACLEKGRNEEGILNARMARGLIGGVSEVIQAAQAQSNLRGMLLAAGISNGRSQIVNGTQEEQWPTERT